MTHQVDARDFHNRDHIVDIDLLCPDECPVCHEKSHPALIASLLSGEGRASRRLNRVYRCANRRCGNAFIAVYEGVPQGGGINRNNCFYFYRVSKPVTPQNPDIPEHVRRISPKFSEVYKQSKYAEDLGLSEVCGVGYRKALEYLVKDYLISQREALQKEEDDIKSMWLGQCINDLLDDEIIREVARRASWLGNDETHYVRKWEDKDINDLKNLLQLAINFIENKFIAAAYIDGMQ